MVKHFGSNKGFGRVRVRVRVFHFGFDRGIVMVQVLGGIEFKVSVRGRDFGFDKVILVDVGR